MRDAGRNEERWKRCSTPTQDPSTDLGQHLQRHPERSAGVRICEVAARTPDHSAHACGIATAKRVVDFIAHAVEIENICRRPGLRGSFWGECEAPFLLASPTGCSFKSAPIAAIE